MATNVPRGTAGESKIQTGSKRLGRGLAQLLSAPTPTPSSTAPVAPSASDAAVSHPAPTPQLGRVVSLDRVPAEPSPVIEPPQTSLPIDRIAPGRYQPRRLFDEAALSGLVESIQHSGVMQPIIVRPVGKPGADGQRYEIVAGERRWRAASKANLREIPVLIRELSDQESAEWSVTENLQREDLNAIEKAWSLRGLIEGFKLTQEQVAQRLGIDRSSVANLVRLTELEPEIAEFITGGQLGAGHGKALLGLAPGEQRLKLAKQAAAAKWSVRQTESATQRLAKGSPAPVPEHAASIHATVLADLERQLGQYLGTKVSIKAGRKKDRGAMSIEFYGLDHFDGLLRKMGFDRA